MSRSDDTRLRLYLDHAVCNIRRRAVPHLQRSDGQYFFQLFVSEHLQLIGLIMAFMQECLDPNMWTVGHPTHTLALISRQK